MNKFKYVSSRSSKTKKTDVNDQEYSKIYAHLQINVI